MKNKQRYMQDRSFAGACLWLAAPARLALFLALLWFPSLFAQSQQLGLNVRYDKFDDLTEVYTSRSNLADVTTRQKRKRDVRLSLRYVCPGTTSHCHPEKIELMFVSPSISEYMKTHKLVLIADGKRIQAAASWDVGYDSNSEHSEEGRHVEKIRSDISADDLVTIAGAKTVEGKLGNTTFKLSADNIAAARALAREMKRNE